MQERFFEWCLCPKHRRERLGLGQEERLGTGQTGWPKICWRVKECKRLEGAVVSEMTKSSFARLIEACNVFDQKVRK